MDRKWIALKKWLRDSKELAQTHVDKTLDKMVALEIDDLYKQEGEEND